MRKLHGERTLFESRVEMVIAANKEHNKSRRQCHKLPTSKAKVAKYMRRWQRKAAKSDVQANPA